MNSLTRRVDKLEDGRECGFYPEPRGNYDIADLERARNRVCAQCTKHEHESFAECPSRGFSDYPPELCGAPSDGFIERLELGRKQALYRHSIGLPC